MNEAHEGGDGFLAAQGDAPEALELVEEAFDLMAFLVEAPIDGRFGGSAWIGLDLRDGAKVVGDKGAYATFMALAPEAREGRGWLVNYHGRGIQDVDRAWATMLTNLGLPQGREWKSYILRHSLATLARNRGAAQWDLEGFMGHSDGSQTEVYAIGEFPSVVAALTNIISEIEKLAPSALHRTVTGASSHNAQRREVKMSG